MSLKKMLPQVRALLGLCVLAGCCAKPPLSARYSLPDEQPDGEPLSSPVAVVGDNQLHHLYGDPFWMRSEISNKIVSTAIRPVQLDLYGQDLLKWMIKRYGSNRPLIHLGDALDLGCTGEFAAFKNAMAGLQQVWVMAPGNHDGYFFGNDAAADPLTRADWQRACLRSGSPMTKDLFVRSYLQVLFAQDDPGARQLHDRFGDSPPDDGNWRYAGDEEAFVRAAAWHIDSSAPWRSYVVQEVNLMSRHSTRPFAAILLDTTEYEVAPQLVPLPSRPNAGLTGDVLSDQLAVVDDWLKHGRPAHQLTVLMGHHPYGDLRKSARASIDQLRQRDPVILFVSAHTHAGQFFVRGEGADTWLELNIGSVLDWPPEMRTLRFLRSRDDGRTVAVTELHRLNTVWRGQSEAVPQCDDAWEAKPGEADYYLTYADGTAAAGATQALLMNTLLHSYARLLTVAPSSAQNSVWPACCASDAAVQAAIKKAVQESTPLEVKIDLLLDLEKFEAARQPKDPRVRRDFRLCQAFWASKYDHIAARAPAVDDWYIVFPKE